MKHADAEFEKYWRTAGRTSCREKLVARRAWCAAWTEKEEDMSNSFWICRVVVSGGRHGLEPDVIHFEPVKACESLNIANEVLVKMKENGEDKDIYAIFKVVR